MSTFFFWSSHLKSSCAFDQKPVTKNLGAACDYPVMDEQTLMLRELAVAISMVVGSGIQFQTDEASND